MVIKYIAISISVMILNIGSAQAQYWFGYSSMHNSGVNSLSIQPASSLGSHYKLDVHIFGIESYSITREVFPLATKILKEDPALFLANNHRDVEGETISFPSFIWKVNKKNAVGFDMKLRSVFAIDPLESSLIGLLTDYINFGNSVVNSNGETLISRSSAWFEMGFNYSRNLLDNEHHKLNIGMTPKVIVGQGSANLQVENVNIEQDFSNGTVDITGRVGLHYSKSIDDWKEDNFKYFDRFSLAFSAGMEYFFYPENEEVYRLKAGVSILDIGRMNYNRSIYAGTFQTENLIVESTYFENVDILNAWAQLVRELFDRVPDESEKLQIALPTKLGFQFDYHIHSGFYVHALTLIALNHTEVDLEQVPNFDTFVFTPRYEKTKWGMAIPFRYDGYSGYSTGVSAFWGPVFIGVNNIFGAAFSSGDFNRLGAYMGFKFNKLWED